MPVTKRTAMRLWQHVLRSARHHDMFVHATERRLVIATPVARPVTRALLMLDANFSRQWYHLAADINTSVNGQLIFSEQGARRAVVVATVNTRMPRAIFKTVASYAPQSFFTFSLIARFAVKRR